MFFTGKREDAVGGRVSEFAFKFVKFLMSIASIESALFDW
jgi:hypothetical protein